MINGIIPKLPMRNKVVTREYYIDKLGFTCIGNDEHSYYLMLQKDKLEIHFFEFMDFEPTTNYGQIYIRIVNIELYYESLMENNVAILPNGHLQLKPWGQKEFSLLDPDNNLLTFGESI